MDIIEQLKAVTEAVAIQQAVASVNRYVCIDELFNVVSTGAFTKCRNDVNEKHHTAWIDQVDCKQYIKLIVAEPFKRDQVIAVYRIYKGGV
jgi:hypothetical protein